MNEKRCCPEIIKKLGNYMQIWSQSMNFCNSETNEKLKGKHQN